MDGQPNGGKSLGLNSTTVKGGFEGAVAVAGNLNGELAVVAAEGLRAVAVPRTVGIFHAEAMFQTLR